MKYEKVRRYPYEIDWRKLASPVRPFDEKAKAQFDRVVGRKDPPTPPSKP